MGADTDSEKSAKDQVTAEEEEQIWNRLLFEAQSEAGDSGVWADGRQIPWLDMKLAQAGQRFFQKHYTSLMFAHALYFGLGFGLKPVTALVIRTQSFHGVKQTTKRILSTIWNLLRWYENDLVGVYTDGYRSVSRIRKTHQAMRRKSQPGRLLDIEIEEEEPGTWDDPLGRALDIDLKHLNLSVFDQMGLTYDPPEQISQFSLAVTQISFLLPVLAHPRTFGIEDSAGVEGFVHLWALIGHLLGIEDRYNIPLLKVSPGFYRRFWEQVWLPSFLIRDSKIGAIQESYYKSVGQFLPQMSVAGNVYFYFCQSDLQGHTGAEIYKLLNWFEKIYIFILTVFFKLIGASTLFRSLMNVIVRFVVTRILTKFKPEVEVEEKQIKMMRRLKRNHSWSQKYKSNPRNPVARYKWKKASSLISLMSTHKTRLNRKQRRT